ncbi:hypothetical protein V8G54_010523 [Vigna mungo]|uniref:Reverse transcriptase Ty1/copia-type domain-containing protein n=1 Tax=Vigna mungo TaxID=3915 RepID=A0AAQ3NYP0_VIGMU
MARRRRQRFQGSQGLHNNTHDSNSLSLPIPHNYHHDYDNVNFLNNRFLVPTPNDPVTNTNEDHMDVHQTSDPDPPTASNDDVTNVQEHNDIIRRSTRSKCPPAYLTDFQTHNITRYPITDFISYNKLSSSFRHTILSISSTIEPRTYKDSSKIPQWTQAMHDELKALEVNKTWIITDLPPGKTPIGCRWIYKIKHKSNGSIDRFKARLVAKGYTQLEGLDYLETFAPVAKLTTLRLLLAIAASNQWILKQLDVNNAFLHGDLHEEVYMQSPSGLLIHKPNQVCKLQRSLYGLKQASRQWYDKLSTFLLSNNYIRSNVDHSFFLKHDNCHTTAILIYMDDIVLSGNNATEIQHITTSLDIKHTRKKLDARAIPGVFLGFKQHTKGYQFLNLQNHKISYVLFHENYFPYTSSHNNTHDSNSLSLPIPHNYHHDYDNVNFLNNRFLVPTPNDPVTNTNEDHMDVHQTSDPDPPTASNDDVTNVQEHNDIIRRSTRSKCPPAYLTDFQTHNITRYPITDFISYNKLSSSFRHTILSISSTIEPRTYKDSSKIPQWTQAMHDELKALEVNKTWIITDLPPGKTPIGCRWIYKIKHKSNGSIDRFKARLVAKGYTQLEGLDYLETFAPVAKLTTLRLLLAIAASNQWILKQLDVNNAFLHGDLHEEVYMQSPSGLLIHKPNQVCKLQRSLYGLKQASRQWYDKLSTFLLSNNYIRSNVDHSFFLKHDNCHTTAILIYMDDIVLSGNNATEIQHITTSLDIKHTRKKLDARAIPGVFLGFKQHTKGYQFLNLQNHKISYVLFHENYFPYTSSHNNTHDSNSLSLPIPHNYHHDYDNVNFLNNRFLVPTPNDPVTNTNEDHMDVHQTSDPDPPTASNDDVTNVQEHNDIIRRSTRSKCPPAYLTDFQTHNITRYPITDLISYNKLSSSFRHTILSISSTIEPRTYKESSKIPQWTQAMHDELKALEVNKTWIITDLPPGKTPIGCRWIYKIKHKSNGSIDRFKARLVAKGYTQLEGLDYLETFAPVAKLTTLRLLLAIAASNQWILKQLDVNNAFLHGDLHEEVYMQSPSGLLIHKPNQVCKLQRSLYGLKQASRQWYDKLSTFLLSNNYIRSNVDHSFFLKHDNCHTTAILIYMDDIVLSGNNATEIQHITTSLDIKHTRKKLDARAIPGVFLGFKQHTKGYQFLNLQNHKISYVLFHENYFPYTSSHNNTHDSNSLSLPIPHNYHHDYDNVNFLNNRFLVPTPNDPVTNTNEDHMDVHQTSDPDPPTASNDDVTNVQEHNDIIRRSTRSKCPPAYLTDFQTHNITRYPITDLISYNKLSSSFRHTILSISSTIEPRTYKESSKIPQWTQAMHDELKALEVNKTWIITDLPPGKTPIGCRWIYKIKHKSNGSIDRFKARLVAKGYTQLEGLDYLETFALVAKLTTLRLLLAIAASNQWILKQLDVNNAFLHGDLHEEVYMQPPSGLLIHKPNQVCKLQRSLYGLKQASRQWYDKLSTFLLSNNYIRSNVDHSFFLKHDNCHTTAILIYMDDIVLSGNNATEIQHITTSLDNLFHIKNLGDLTYFLGLDQRKYTLDLVTEAGMLNCAPMPTPMAHSSRLTSEGDLLNDEDASSYRRLIGRLIYLTNTRPDITFSVNNLNQFVSVPTTIHQQAANRILRYLKGSPGNDIFLQTNSIHQLKAYSDSDWATCPESRKSITGYSIYFGNSIISSKSKKQQTVSRSSSEAEYRALANVTCEIQWLTYILQDLRISIVQPAIVYCDNRLAIQIATNQVFHERTKNIEIDCHIVREKINNGLLKLLPISTNEQAVDLFTKPLAPSTFKYLKSKLGMTDIYSQLEGGVKVVLYWACLGSLAHFP